MRIEKLGTLLSIALGFAGTGVQLVDPEQVLVGWIFIGLAAVVAAVSIAGWLLANIRLGKPPLSRWLSGLIFGISTVGAIGCLAWYLYSNRSDALTPLSGLRGTEIVLPRPGILVGVIVGGLVLFSTVLMIRGIRIMRDPYLTMRRVIAMQWAGWLLVAVGCVIAVIGLTIVAHGAEKRSDPRGITYASQEFPPHRIRWSARS